MDPAQAVRDLVCPLLSDVGIDLYDVEVLPGILRVLIDREGGVDLEAITSATAAISDALDGCDPLDGSYTLEVSSPGLERPLRRPEHYRRSIGDAVAVRTRPGVPGDRRAEGLLLRADDLGITISSPGGDVRTLRYEEIERARSVFQWGPAPKPTASRPRSKKPAKASGKATAS
jgi:ribosome maturation factor RimP